MEDMKEILDELRRLPHETEWVEFKTSNWQEIGEYISALSNSACLHNKPKGYLVFGVENKTHSVVGTDFKPRKEKIGNQPLEHWLARLLDPRIDFAIHEFQHAGHNIVLMEIDATKNHPVKFKGTAFIRVGSCKTKLSEHPEKERKIWKKSPGYDWSAEICAGASLSDLEPEAITKARIEYRGKNPKMAGEINQWDNQTFLNKAKITIENKITPAAIILLGKDEASHFLLPYTVQITWILKDEHNAEKDYQHFGIPFLLTIEKVFAKVRNLTYRYMPDGTLFPQELTQYEPWVIREALHNCIAHQDYEMRSRINVVEKPDELIFVNAGAFTPGSVEEVIRQNAPQKYYRNPFLVQAMVNLNLIDTIGGGIKRMYMEQWRRKFPLPTYDLGKTDEVTVRIPGKIINENYTRLLAQNTDFDLETVMLLDKVQKKIAITREQHALLKQKRIVEGRFPNLFVAAQVASVIGKKAEYIRNRGFDKKYYQDMIIAFVKKNDEASRTDVDSLLLKKMPEVLTEQQKFRKINNILTEMAGKLRILKNVGTRKQSRWILAQDKNK